MLRWAALAAAQIAGPQCALEIEGSLCLNGGQQVVLPPGVPAGLVGHWAFGGQRVVDRSGHGHDAAGEVQPGPARAAGGPSGLFDRSFLLVPHAETLPQGSFTYAAFVFFGHHPDEAVSATWCPVLQKGSPESHAPALVSSPERVLKVQVAQVGAARPVELASQAQLPAHQWVHVAVTYDEKTRMLQLYLDGMRDAATQVAAGAVANDLPLYIGGDPWTQDTCFRRVALDDVRAYDRALTGGELRAHAAPAGSDLVALGCLRCTRDEAAAACGEHRVCSGLELHSGALQAAARLGWWASGQSVWTAAEKGGRDHALGLCCD